MILNDIANLILVFGAFPASIVFLVLFSVTRSPWWRDPLGWVIFSLAASVVVTFAVSFAFLMFGPDYWGREWFRLVAYSFLTLAFIAKSVAVVHERLRRPTSKERS